MVPQQTGLTKIKDIPSANRFEQVQLLSILLMQKDRSVTTKKLHGPNLPLTGVPKSSIRLEIVFIAKLPARVSREQKDQRMIRRRTDTTLPLPSVFLMQGTPSINLTSNKFHGSDASPKRQSHSSLQGLLTYRIA
jgi:hypothetical protein